MKISACYIVKNEAKNIEESINSLANQVDEILVADTGSTDDTVAIAQKLGAVVYSYPWQGDFAAAKNFIMSKATGDWLILLDADEYFTPATRGNLRQLIIENPNPMGYLVEMANVDQDNNNSVMDKFYQLRVVKYQKGLAYRGKIHEELYCNNERMDYNMAYVRPEVLQIYHTGYSKNILKSKAKRNLALLQQEMVNGTIAPEKYRYLHECYAILGNKAEAERYAWLDVEQPRGIGTYSSQCHRYLLSNFADGNMLAQREKRLDLVKKTLKKFPEVPDFYGEYGAILLQWHRYREAVANLQRALELWQDYDGVEPCLLTDKHIESIKGLLTEYQPVAETEKTLRISACVILKNEEKNLPAWLDNAEEYADEIVLVDTGSTDKTLAIAQARGQKYYQYPWQDDFAAARNFTLAQATGDWVVFLDADELLKYPQSLRGLLARCQTRGERKTLSVPFQNVDADNSNIVLNTVNLVRIFPKAVGYRYQGAVHEQLVDALGQVPETLYGDFPLTVVHTGYSGSIIRAKLQRNLRLLDQELATTKTPEKYYFYLADCFFGLGNYQYALDNALLAIQSSYQPRGQQGAMYNMALKAMEELNYPLEDRLAVAQVGQTVVPDIPDVYGWAGLVLAEQKQWVLAVTSLQKALAVQNTRGQQTVLDQSSEFATLCHRVETVLGDCYMALDNTLEARQLYRRVLGDNPWYEQALVSYLSTYEDVLGEEVVQQLESWYGQDLPSQEKLLELLALKGFRNLLLLLRNRWQLPVTNSTMEQWYQRYYAGLGWQDCQVQCQSLLSQQQILFVSLLCSKLDCNQYLLRKEMAMVPEGLAKLVKNYQLEKPIEQEAWDDYWGMLPTVLDMTPETVQKKYLSLLHDLEAVAKFQVAELLWEKNKHQEAMDIYDMIEDKDKVQEPRYWLGCGKILYHNSCYEDALLCFQQASTWGMTSPELAAYETWCREELAQ